MSLCRPCGDLEWLLNTRFTLRSTNGWKRHKKPVLTYGLPDITGISAKNQSGTEGFSYAIESAIRYFEPRFLDVRVTLSH
ncbi:MAG: GPW/gp25 family protein [Acidobacteria bacterium]|nr:GPW/gp25 family protein [Acidobacteriota bacterium]